MAEHFVYEFLKIPGMGKPILTNSFTTEDLFGGDRENFNFDEFVAKRISSGLVKKLLVYSKSTDWIVFYSKTYPPEYYTVSDGFLVDAE